MLRSTLDPVISDERLLAELSHHAMVDESHRLVLFTIPKVGCTELIKLMRRLRGAQDWQAPPHHQPDRPVLRDLGVARVGEILNDPSWTTAAVFRDPAERLLSAYLDKFIHSESYAADLFRPAGRGMPFDEFLRYVLAPNRDPELPVGLHAGTDPHWRPQRLVGPLDRVAIDLPGDFTSIGEWAERVLRRVGAWEEFGAIGWGAKGRESIFEPNTADNRTGAGGRMPEFYDDDTLRAVYDAYAGDIVFARAIGIDLVKHGQLLG